MSAAASISAEGKGKRKIEGEEGRQRSWRKKRRRKNVNREERRER